MWLAEPGLLQQLLEPDQTGHALLHGLAPGRYTVKAFPDDFLFEPASFELQDPDPETGETPTVEIRWRMR